MIERDNHDPVSVLETDLSQICLTAYSNPDRAGQTYTNRFNGLNDCPELRGFAQIQNLKSVDFGRTGSSPALGTVRPLRSHQILETHTGSESAFARYNVFQAIEPAVYMNHALR